MSGNESVGDRQTASASVSGGTLSRRVRWLFGTGDLTTSAPLAIVSFFQLFFLTDVARLSPALAAWAILCGKMWDAVNDPICGVLADRIRSRFGRRRILLVIGAVPVGVSFLLMWVVPSFSDLGLVIYYALTYVLFDTCYTVVHIAYNSLTPELSADYDEQSTLNGVRMFYSIFGSLLAIIGATVLGWYIEDPATLFLMLGIGLGAVIIIPPLVVVRVTKGRDVASGGEQPPTIRGIREVLTNRPFWLVMGIYLTSWTAVSIIAADLVYFARYNMGVPGQANYFVLVAQGVAILFIPLVVAIARRWDKRTAVFVGLGSMVPLLVCMGTIAPTAVTMIYVLAAMLGFGIATAYVTPWSMIPDVIQYDRSRSGVKREASYYAIVAFFQKLGTAGALWLMAQVLSATGYVTPTEAAPIPVQPFQALSAIRLFISAVPGALLLASVLFAAYYPITREVQGQLRAQLDEG